MRRGSALLLGVVVAAVAVGCSGSSKAGVTAGASSSDSGLVVTSTTAAPPTSSPSSGPVTVTVDAGDYYFHSSVSTFTVGVPYHFEVTNTGTVPHEFMLVQPMAPGMMDMEAMDKMAVAHIEEDDLPPGATASLDVTFDHAYASGTLEMSCHLGQHYEKGMHIPIVVQP